MARELVKPHPPIRLVIRPSIRIHGTASSVIHPSRYPLPKTHEFPLPPPPRFRRRIAHPVPGFGRRPAEHPDFLCGRSRLGGTRLPGLHQGHSDAAHRFPRQERHAIHQRLRRRDVLQPVARRADDRSLPDALRPRVQLGRQRRRPPQRPDHDGDAAESARLRHGCRRQMAPRQPAGEPPHPARLRRVLRHPQQHAVLPSDRLRRFAGVQRGAGREGPGFLHHRRLRRARGRLDREEQGQAVVPLSAVQRPARAAAGPEEVSRALSRRSPTRSASCSPR